jgi:hypothetical protein
MNNPIILGLESYQTHIPYTYEPIAMTMVPPWFPMFSPIAWNQRKKGCHVSKTHGFLKQLLGTAFGFARFQINEDGKWNASICYQQPFC